MLTRFHFSLHLAFGSRTGPFGLRTTSKLLNDFGQLWVEWALVLVELKNFLLSWTNGDR
jgi:hypothetical protein